MIVSVLERLLAKITIGEEFASLGRCWLFTGARCTRGYGQIKNAGRDRLAHRVAYEELVGPIPDGLQLDHLCRVRRCVNPAHLEPVTCRENLLRGETVAAVSAARTHCPQGHELEGANLAPSELLLRGKRKCLACRRAQDRARHRRNRERQRARAGLS